MLEQRGDVGEAGRVDEGLGAIEIAAPAVAGDRGDVGDRAALAQLRRQGLAERAQAVEVDRQRLGGARHAGDAGDVAQRVEPARQGAHEIGDRSGGRDVGLDEGAERRGRGIDVDADHVGAERDGELADAGADA